MKYVLLFILISYSSLFSVKAEEFEPSNFVKKSRLEFNKENGRLMFSKRDYASAITYLERAYQLDRWDVETQELLYFSYLYMNRGFEARQFYYALSPATRSAYRLEKPKTVSSAYLEGGLLNMVEGDYSLPSELYYQEKAVSGTGQCYTAKVSHDLGSMTEVSHSVSYTYSAADQYVDSMAVSIFKGDVSTRQFSYTIDAPIHLGKGWVVTPSAYLSYVKNRYYVVSYDTAKAGGNGDNGGFVPFDPWQGNPFPPYDGAGTLRQGGFGGGFPNSYQPFPNFNGFGGFGGFGGYYMPMMWWWGMPGQEWNWNDTYAYKFDCVEDDAFNYAFELEVANQFYRSEYSAALTYLHGALQDFWKVSAQWLYYPKGNLDLYSVLRASYLMRELVDNDVLLEGLVGFKARNWLWVELGGLWGNMNGYSDRRLNVVYALQPQTSYKLFSNLIFPLTNQMSLNLLYRFVKSETSLYYVSTSELVERKDYSVYANNIFLGVKWSF